ncbi:MAG TPA: sialidase family protein [Gemmatimonadaceae bacterium]
MRNHQLVRLLPSITILAIAACTSDGGAPNAPLRATGSASHAGSPGGGSTSRPVNVSDDTTAQNETPIAINPLNPQNMLIGANDWNYNGGCSFNTTFDGGKTWTKTLPNGFIPAITRFTNDPSVPGTGSYDLGGDPAVAFGPDGTAYFACFGYKGTSAALFLSRSTDGGKTWPTNPAQLALVTAFNGGGKAGGSNGQFPDHDAIHVAKDGTVYLTWAQFNGLGAHSPVYLATSTDGGRSFNKPVTVSSGSVGSDQDQRIVTDPRTGTAYVTFDNTLQGHKGVAMYVAVSSDRGRTWGKPIQFARFQNPVCLFPPDCFNISGTPFRGPGSYPAPAFDPVRNRLYVAYSDIVNGRAQVLLTWASTAHLDQWSTPMIVAPSAGDRINVEISIEPGSGRIDVMTNDRSWSGNSLFDVTYLSSGDGGVTWSAKRVTASSWDPSAFGVPESDGTIEPFIGDYDGIASLPGGAAIAWTGPGKTFGALPTNLEAYFAFVAP